MLNIKKITAFIGETKTIKTDEMNAPMIGPKYGIILVKPIY